MLKYLLLLPVHIIAVLLRYPLAPVAVLFSKDNDLTYGWRWLGTIDWPLTGDDGWREEHLVGDDPASFLNKTRWLWRNGANRINYFQLGEPAGVSQFWSLKTTPGWQWRLGWNPYDSKQGRAKYNFTVRYRKG